MIYFLKWFVSFSCAKLCVLPGDNEIDAYHFSESSHQKYAALQLWMTIMTECLVSGGLHPKGQGSRRWSHQRFAEQIQLKEFCQSALCLWKSSRIVVLECSVRGERIWGGDQAIYLREPFKWKLRPWWRCREMGTGGLWRPKMPNVASCQTRIQMCRWEPRGRRDMIV